MSGVLSKYAGQLSLTAIPNSFLLLISLVYYHQVLDCYSTLVNWPPLQILIVIPQLSLDLPTTRSVRIYSELVPISLYSQLQILPCSTQACAFKRVNFYFYLLSQASEERTPDIPLCNLLNLALNCFALLFTLCAQCMCLVVHAVCTM